MNIEQETAQALVQRAMGATLLSEMNLLLGAAKRLDPTLKIETLKTQWLKVDQVRTQIEREQNPIREDRWF